ncbi:ATP-binding protein [Sphaerisporangium rufum]|nr:ATP-binding protein [Sphaerisporangium rufum]
MAQPRPIPPHPYQTATGILLGVTDLPGSPESASRARAWIRDRLGEDHPALEDVTLLVSEVVTNSVIHSASRDGGKVTLAIADCHEFIHIDVVDDGAETEPRVCGDPFGESGRGLMLVDVIARNWGVYTDPAGRTVWFQCAYRRRAADSPSLACPRPRVPAEPTPGHESALRRTARQAAQTVADSARQEQALRLVQRWDLDPDGLNEAARRIGVAPMDGMGTRH